MYVIIIIIIYLIHYDTLNGGTIFPLKEFYSLSNCQMTTAPYSVAATRL